MKSMAESNLFFSPVGHNFKRESVINFGGKKYPNHFGHF